MNVYKVELYDSKNNEFFFVEVEASCKHEALCSAEVNWEHSYAVMAEPLIH